MALLMLDDRDDILAEIVPDLQNRVHRLAVEPGEVSGPWHVVPAVRHERQLGDRLVDAREVRLERCQYLGGRQVQDRAEEGHQPGKFLGRGRERDRLEQRGRVREVLAQQRQHGRLGQVRLP